MRTLPLLGLAIALSACADAPEPLAPSENVVPAAVFDLADPYVRAAPSGGVSAMFMSIENPTPATDTLMAVRTDAASRIEIHRTQENADGLSEMVPVERLAVPAGETVTLAPGGLHVMLLDLQRDLVAGDTLDVEVEFTQQGTMAVRAPIRGL